MIIADRASFLFAAHALIFYRRLAGVKDVLRDGTRPRKWVRRATRNIMFYFDFFYGLNDNNGREPVVQAYKYITTN